MKYLSVCPETLHRNKKVVDVTLYDPPIVVWENGKEIKRVFSYEFEDSIIIYKPESPLPNGSTVYIEVYE